MATERDRKRCEWEIWFRMREALAIKNLRDAKEIFDKFGIKCWLDSGTLLGAGRDGKIMEWDEDIDLAAMDYSWEKTISTIIDPIFHQL